MEGAQPSTSDAVISPRKRRRPVPLSVTEKTMVQNIFNNVFKEEEQKLDLHLGEKPNKRLCAQKTADILGIGTATVFNVLKDIKENVTPTPPQRPGPKLALKDKCDAVLRSTNNVESTSVKVTEPTSNVEAIEMYVPEYEEHRQNVKVESELEYSNNCHLRTSSPSISSWTDRLQATKIELLRKQMAHADEERREARERHELDLELRRRMHEEDLKLKREMHEADLELKRLITKRERLKKRLLFLQGNKIRRRV